MVDIWISQIFYLLLVSLKDNIMKTEDYQKNRAEAKFKDVLQELGYTYIDCYRKGVGTRANWFAKYNDPNTKGVRTSTLFNLKSRAKAKNNKKFVTALDYRNRAIRKAEAILSLYMIAPDDLVRDERTNAWQVKYRCPNGHDVSTSYYNLKSKHEKKGELFCPLCRLNKPKVPMLFLSDIRNKLGSINHIITLLEIDRADLINPIDIKSARDSINYLSREERKTTP